jgi:FkbM family methyltransferase
MGELRIPGISRSLMLRTHESDEWISPSIERYGIWEPYETEVILRNLREGDVFVDIGANIGYYSVIAASAVGDNGKVFAFEPDPTNYDLLEQNIAANGFENVRAFRKAVSSSSDERYLYLCERNKGDHRLYDSRDSRTRIAVPCIDLDSRGLRQIGCSGFRSGNPARHAKTATPRGRPPEACPRVLALRALEERLVSRGIDLLAAGGTVRHPGNR